MQPILLDTCAVIWLAAGEDLSPAAVKRLRSAAEQRDTTFISPITAWEIGMLSSRGRLQMLITPQRWFSRAVKQPGVQLADMSSDLLIESSFLPGRPPRDPADRIIAATARDLGATLITRDHRLLEYAEQGHMKVIEC
ncbi:MAG: type II toxin-antitoxin system VapC family toxin [Pseudolabrys sp.]|jgi:PIN domain nuclease of toxin-antitoxin system